MLKLIVYRMPIFMASALPASVAPAQDYNEQPTPEELAKLGLEGTELTPAGAIRAGNAQGTIPTWKFEPIQPPLEPLTGDVSRVRTLSAVARSWYAINRS